MDTNIENNNINLTRSDWSDDEKDYRRSVAIFKQFELLGSICDSLVSEATDERAYIA